MRPEKVIIVIQVPVKHVGNNTIEEMPEHSGGTSCFMIFKAKIIFFVSNYSNTNTEYEKKQINEAFSLIAEREFQNLTDEKSRRVYEVLTKLKEN